VGRGAYITKGNRFDKLADNHHLLLLAKNNAGYKNLMKLSSLAFLEGFYYKSRIDKELLKKYSEGLICTSACLKGEIPSLFEQGNGGAVRKALVETLNIFGDDFYLEIQDHGIEEEKVYEDIYKTAIDMGIRIVATNDTHFLTKENHLAHNALLCIQMAKSIYDKNNLQYSHELYLKSIDEMLKLFKGKPDVLENTFSISEK
jgi:DNA polymerase-3 subunit alpha